MGSAGEGLDPGHVHFGELVNEREDAAELGLQAGNVRFIHAEAGEAGNAADGRGIERHGEALSGWNARTITGRMGLFNMVALRAGLSRGQRLIGIDPGAKRIGLALTDVTLTLASPYGVIARGKLRVVAASVVEVARREGVGGLVVGWPLSMDGSVGPAAQAVRDWAGDLSAAVGLPAALWDERLSTAAVNRHLIGEMDLSRKKRAASVDAMAAAYTLQAALDASAPGSTLVGAVVPKEHEPGEGRQE